MAIRGSFEPERFRNAETLLRLPWFTGVDEEAKLHLVADRFLRAVDRLETPARTLVQICFGISESEDPATFSLPITRRIGVAASRVPVSADHARQEQLPTALAEIAFQLTLFPALATIGKIEPLGYRVKSVEVIDEFDSDDPNVRTTTTRLLIEFSRDKVLVLPRLWLPAPAWTALGKPWTTSLGHSYIGSVPKSAGSHQDEIAFFFLGTDNALGDTTLVEFHRKGILPLTASNKLRCEATDETERIRLALERPPAPFAAFRSAVYEDPSLLTPTSASPWKDVSKGEKIEAEWCGHIRLGQTYQLEWRPLDK